jgi:hypothetical protein
MDTRTVTISSKEIDSAIEVLSSAGQEFQLTRFERFAYRALMVSADVAVACVVLGIPCDVLTGGLEGHLWDPLGARDAAGEMLPLEQVSPAAFFVLMLNLLFSLIFVAASLVAIVSLVLNIPLFRKAGRESARLRELGLSSFSHSLLKESRRGRWINRVRGVFLLVRLSTWCWMQSFFSSKRGWLAEA